MLIYIGTLNEPCRYAMKREVAVIYGLFPPSMSDFKPGDTILGMFCGKFCPNVRQCVMYPSRIGVIPLSGF